MAITEVFRPLGPTAVISVTGSSSTAITIPAPVGNEVCTMVTILNTGATTVAIHAEQQSAAAAVLPVAGTPSDSIVLPPSMTRPIGYVIPGLPCSMTAIGSGAGPSLVYIQPVGNQS